MKRISEVFGLLAFTGLMASSQALAESKTIDGVDLPAELEIKECVFQLHEQLGINDGPINYRSSGEGSGNQAIISQKILAGQASEEVAHVYVEYWNNDKGQGLFINAGYDREYSADKNETPSSSVVLTFNGQSIDRQTLFSSGGSAHDQSLYAKWATNTVQAVEDSFYRCIGAKDGLASVSASVHRVPGF